MDLVFNEPGFPCTVCQPSCVLPREDLPTVSGTNLIFVDNVAHSNREAGWWIKENWVPDGGQNIISGFLVYKNRIGGKKSDILFNFEVENYGIAHLKFDHIIAADNAVGATIDWIREGSTTFSDSLFIGETENHGNPSDPNWSDSTSCSVIFPGISRTQGFFPLDLSNGLKIIGEVYQICYLKLEIAIVTFTMSFWRISFPHAKRQLSHTSLPIQVGNTFQPMIHFDSFRRKQSRSIPTHRPAQSTSSSRSTFI